MSKKQYGRNIKIGNDSLDLHSVDFNSSFEVSLIPPRTESTPFKRKTTSRKRKKSYPSLIDNITPIKQAAGRWIVSDVPTQVAMLTDDNSVLGTIDLGTLESKENENDGKPVESKPESGEQPLPSQNVVNWTDDSLLCNVVEGEQQVSSPKLLMHEKLRLALISNAQKPVTPRLHTSVHLNLERVVECNSFDIGPFFGLPSRVEDLVKSVKNIKKLYEWQEECLNLPALKERRNLLYALPTSGGKTLVAEILILKEILCHKRNAIFVLPYVSIVQEKVRSMSPFAVELNFLIEEYAGGKGRYPPTRHRKKNIVFIATIEKALGLVNSLLEVKRESELGLVVVDELHLVGETTSTRAATLEIFLAKLKFATAHVQIVGMSATIGNLEELSKFLGAEIYTNNFRPVELKEYVKCGDAIWEVTSSGEQPLIMTRKLGPAPSAKDPDQITVLVGEVVPSDSCLVFCSTKKGCENVAVLICDHLSKELLQHRKSDKEAILRTIVSEGSGALCPTLAKTIPFGVAYHHAGLTGDERRLLEEAFSSGTLCALCCTSTLAAGVNLPARRVVLRSPYVGNSFINLSRYKQMVGRAGRAGFGEVGESFLVCKPNEIHKVIDLLKAPMDNATSSLHLLDGVGMRSLVISSVGLGIANSRAQLKKMMNNTLLSVQAPRLGVDVGDLVDRTVVDLTKLGALRVGKTEVRDVSVLMSTTGNAPGVSSPSSKKKKLTVFSNTLLEVSRLGKAAMKGPVPLHLVERLRLDLVEAQASLVLLTNLHLLYLVTPYDLVDQISPQPDVYFSVFSDLDKRDKQTAKVLNVTEGCLVALMKGQKVRSVERPVLNRFYLTLILNELWNRNSVWLVSDKYRLNRGFVQNLMVSSSTFASCVTRFCEELPEFWAFKQLFSNFSEQLSHCCTAELVPLMELPAVKRSRAKQLYNAGFKTLTDVANADPGQVVKLVDHMSRKTANQKMADVFREPEPEWSATLLDSRSYVLHDRLMTDAALGAAPIKTEHSYSAAPDSPLGLEAIDGMEEDVFPALASRRRASRDSESPVTVKDEPLSEPASPESCRPLSPSPPPPSPSPTIVKREPRTPVQQSVLKAPTTILVSAPRGSLFAPQKVVVPKLSIKIEPSPGFPLPPTPPSSTSSDSEGNLSPDHDPVSPRHPQQQQAPRLFLAAANRQPIQTPLISSQPKGSTGMLMLTEEEKRTLLAEGYPIPTRLPLTKAEEKSLKKIRRKIKNKISAQESRRKKKEYMDALERKVELLSGENSDYKKKIENLEENNTSLLSQLHKLQALLARGTTPAARFASALAARASQK